MVGKFVFGPCGLCWLSLRAEKFSCATFLVVGGGGVGLVDVWLVLPATMSLENNSFGGSGKVWVTGVDI